MSKGGRTRQTGKNSVLSAEDPIQMPLFRCFGCTASLILDLIRQRSEEERNNEENCTYNHVLTTESL